MKKTNMILAIMLIIVTAAAGCSLAGGLMAKPDISGTWNGEVKSASGDIQRGVMEIVKEADGSYSGTLIGAGQGGQNIPVEVITLENNKIHFEIPSISGVFDGTIDKNAATITGIWLISGNEFTVTMKKE